MTRADAMARTLSDRFHLDTLPVDLDKVAGELGVMVVRQPAETDVNGMLLQREEQDVIGLNDRHSPESQRFSLAHLIGHHQIHHRRDLLIDVANRYRLGNLASTPTDREEVEANRFAAALLVPEEVVRRMTAEADFQTARQLVDLLAPRFEVSSAVMGFWLMALGIVMDY
ncbi:ImmA/IrrE family metallo-endopeptidase [Streptomyces flaveolus]|uniref:ImmA/IrrE family metallo-endopeptidase n=1 Tax=Streptomyces TaxID=1883 RepID=UPI0033BA22DE